MPSRYGFTLRQTVGISETQPILRFQIAAHMNERVGITRIASAASDGSLLAIVQTLDSTVTKMSPSVRPFRCDVHFNSERFIPGAMKDPASNLFGRYGRIDFSPSFRCAANNARFFTNGVNSLAITNARRLRLDGTQPYGCTTVIYNGNRDYKS
jgi:hypothetical protein